MQKLKCDQKLLKAKQASAQSNLTTYMSFYTFHLLNRYVLFHL